jgi:hypothetical protein
MTPPRQRASCAWLPVFPRQQREDLGGAVCAVATMTTSFGGLYWLAAAMALATTTGLINNWVLLVEIKR